MEIYLLFENKIQTCIWAKCPTVAEKMNDPNKDTRLTDSIKILFFGPSPPPAQSEQRMFGRTINQALPANHIHL